MELITPEIFNDALDPLERYFMLAAIQEKLADTYHICTICSCYKIKMEWEENHPYGDTAITEKWVSYTCPICGIK